MAPQNAGIVAKEDTDNVILNNAQETITVDIAQPDGTSEEKVTPRYDRLPPTRKRETNRSQRRGAEVGW